mgnify:CR=1 FL=1
MLIGLAPHVLHGLSEKNGQLQVFNQMSFDCILGLMVSDKASNAGTLWRFEDRLEGSEQGLLVRGLLKSSLLPEEGGTRAQRLLGW